MAPGIATIEAGGLLDRLLSPFYTIRGPEFLAIYASTSREDILQNRSNVSENLGFLCRLIHGASPRNWLKELKLRLGEVVDYAEIND